MIYNKSIETMPREDIEQLQIERLQTTLNRVYRNVAFYKQIFDKYNLNIEKIKTIQDLRSLPFTTRNDLSKSYPYDMFAVPLREIVRIHSTSGTTGRPIVVGYTKNDLKHWAECTARLLSAVGIDEHDVVQIAFHYDLFTGGFGFHQGAELLGASVIPASTSTSVDNQIIIMKDFKTTALLCTPSFALHLANELEKKNIHPEELYLKTGLFGAEPWSEGLRAQLEQKLHIQASDTYGLTEIIGPGVAGECKCKEGLHINEDHFIAEVINPDTMEPLPAGEKGELVFTTITKEGFPLIRYRTGDMAAFLPGKCKCGRTLMRMSRVTGRTDNLIFIEECKFFPSQIEQILLQIEGTAPHYQIILDREAGNDTIEIKVEINTKVMNIDEPGNLEKLKNNIANEIKKTLGIDARITLVEPSTLPRAGKNKTNRVIDKRKL